VILRNRAITALTVAQLISALGSQMTWLALPWFVLVTTGSASRMAVVFAVEVLPVALFGLLSGTVVQRWGTRRTMLVAEFSLSRRERSRVIIRFCWVCLRLTI